MLTFIYIAIGVPLLLVIVALHQERLREVLRYTLLCCTGAFLIAPLQAFLGRLLISVSGFMGAQMAHGEPSDSQDAEEALAADENRGSIPAVSNATPAEAEEAGPQAQIPPSCGPIGFHLGRLLVSILFTAATVIFLAFEISLNKPTFDAMGLDPSGAQAGVPGPAGLLSWVSALALLAVVVVWGVVLLDLHGFTQVLPAPPRQFRRVVLRIAWLCVVMGVFTAFCMGLMRGINMTAPLPAATAVPAGAMTTQGDTGSVVVPRAPDITALQDPGLGESDSSRNATLLVMVLLPTLSLLSAALTFTGVLWLARYLALFIVGLLLLVPALVLYLGLPLLDHLFGALDALKDSAFSWLGEVGQGLVNTFWPPLEGARDAWHLRTGDWAKRWAGRTPTHVRHSGADEAFVRQVPGQGKATGVAPLRPLDNGIPGDVETKPSFDQIELGPEDDRRTGGPQAPELEDMNWGWGNWNTKGDRS